MMDILTRMFTRSEPALTEASPRDAAAMAALHAISFRRGWSDGEIEALLVDESVLAHRAMLGRTLVGFILSRRAAGEAEILSVAVTPSSRGRGLGAAMLQLHLRQLAGLGVQAVFLEVDEDNASACRLYSSAGFHEVARREGYYCDQAGRSAAALVLRRDLV
jgi:ribosomal-protein-alanine N-acetyltransferase